MLGDAGWWAIAALGVVALVGGLAVLYRGAAQEIACFSRAPTLVSSAAVIAVSA
jgi:hypothetical protein